MKLFALTMIYAVKREPKRDKIKDKANPKRLWTLIEKKDKVQTASKVKEIMKLTTIVKPSLLRALVSAEKAVKVNGVGCLQLKVDHMGYLDNFSRVYASEETRAKVLSFTEVKRSATLF